MRSRAYSTSLSLIPPRSLKASGITNAPNDWTDEHEKPKYILDLLLSVITVSVETVKIVKGLPRLEVAAGTAVDGQS